jgi:pseudouridine synthase
LDSPKPSRNKLVRLQKYLAECGIASRRASEELIGAGHVTVNGRPVTQQGTLVDPQADTVRVDARLCRPQAKLYILMNKPRGVLCTCRDPQGRRTFLDLLPRQHERLYPVGRLDYDSEGLLIVTNDGTLACALAHPRHAVAKTYHVRVDRSLAPAELRQMRDGVSSEGEILRVSRVVRLAGDGGSAVYEVILHEGRNRQIRRMLAALGLGVLTLQRVAEGPLTLQQLRPGQWRHLTTHEVDQLRTATAPGPRQPP